MARSVAIIGAGFSGLVTAYFCVKQGFQVHVYEKQNRAGGLISTPLDEFGRSESAANGILDSDLLRLLATDLGLLLFEPKKTATSRYIFRKKPRRYPLGIGSSLRLASFLTRYLIHRSAVAPLANESLRQWGHRCLGKEATEYLLEPAFSGIYAGDSARLSASLVLGRMFQKNRVRRKAKGGIKTLSPCNGMEELIEKLKQWLINHGVDFHFGSDIRSLDQAIGEFKILSCGPQASAELLKNLDLKLSSLLSKIEMLPLVSATLFFEAEEDDIEGFGCLFPQRENFHSRGVLFNTDIFENRSDYRSETWIMGGATRPELVQCTDEEILSMLNEDRKQLTGRISKPVSTRIFRWPRAIPHFTLEHEALISQINQIQVPGVYLIGNYTERIGLSDILHQAELLAKRIGEAN